ncbi:MAG: hypothetical protein HY841_11625 [Bacteroidetes bacterium]|nr:hypothetical protein [Bacteroidota bacterium]
MKKVLLPLAAIFVSIISHSQSGEKWSFGLNSPSGTAAFGTSNLFPVIIKTNGTEWMRVTPAGNVGIGTSSPVYKLDIAGKMHSRGNAYFDSLLTAFTVQCDALYVQNDAVIKGSAHINKDAHIVGVLTVGSNVVPCPKCGPGSGGSGTIVIDGIKGSIISSSGKIDFDANELKTTGRTISDFATINKQLSAGNITIQTGNSGAGSIVSSSGKIDFDGNDLNTTGTVNSSNISSLQTSVGNQQTQISNLSSRVDSINASQWITNQDSSISFPGTVFVKNLNAENSISIANFRFSNGGAIPQPIIRDSIRTPNQLVLASGAEKIMFDADSVMMGNTARVGNGQLSVAGNITASGDISSNTLTTGSIVTSQLIIDTLHAISRVAVNHSLMIEKQTAKSYAEVSTTDTAVALVLQKDSAGKGVGIGITPSAGERLSVLGNVGVSGKLRLTNLAGNGDRVLAVDSNGVLKDFPNSCFGLNAFWKTDGNIVPANCNPFIGTTNNFALNFRTANLPRMTITAAGNVGIGTTTPGINMSLEVQGSVSIYDGNGNTSLFFGREQTSLQNQIAADYGEWGIQYWSASSNGSSLGGLNFWKPSGSDAGYGNHVGGSVNAFLFLGDDGNIGMGVDPSKIDPQYKLSVNGAIRTTKVVVEIGWNDWVFNSNHKLQPFTERMNDIFTNQRMPDMQSEQEVVANGADLGKNLSGLQRNTEEIYLYMNQMYNIIQQQQKTIEQLKLEIEKK